MKRQFTLIEIIVLALIFILTVILIPIPTKKPAPTPDEIRQKIVEGYGEQWAKVRTGDLLRNTALPDRPIHIFFNFNNDFNNSGVEVFPLNQRAMMGSVVLPLQGRTHQWEIIPRGDGELPSEEWVRALDEHLQHLRSLVAGEIGE